MEKRALGTTGLQVSVLGFGGFHLVEIPAAVQGEFFDKLNDLTRGEVETKVL